jgi:hypothetical protein
MYATYCRFIQAYMHILHTYICTYAHIHRMHTRSFCSVMTYCIEIIPYTFMHMYVHTRIMVYTYVHKYKQTRIR